MSRYLMIDFGSTFTKLTAVDTECEDIIATASHFTTVFFPLVAFAFRIGFSRVPPRQDGQARSISSVSIRKVSPWP